MKRTMRHVLILGGLLLAACIVTAPVAQAKDIKVGAAINLTGPASTWGQYHAKGQQDYFRYVNEVKGGVKGNRIDMITVDTAYKPAEAVAAVRKFAMQDRVDMIATWSAGEGIQAKPLLQEYKIPAINYSTAWEILQPPVDYMYLPFGNYRLDCAVVMEYVAAVHKGPGAPKVGLLTYNNPYGKSIHEPSREYAKAMNIEIVSVEEFPPQTVDLTTELLRLKQKGAQYVFIQMLPSAIISTLKSSDRIGYSPMFIGTWTSTDPDFFKNGQGLIRDRIKMQFCGGLPSDKGKGMKVMEELWKRYKTVDSFDTAYWEGVVVGMIMERAFIRAQEKYGQITPENINKAMETFRNEDFGGLVPNVTYTRDDHGASFSGRIVQIHENGTFTPLTNFFTPGKEKIKILKVK
ncbi:MAG: ABC transporter substrate-binding protein [Desulfobacterota bacterium]|nr:ABC transporter substrate-binding protein [Thermodesulfobacteriota bacterium]